MATTDNFTNVTELPPDSDYHKLKGLKNYRLALVRLPSSLDITCIKSFNIDPITNRIASANFTDNDDDLGLEIGSTESNYSMFVPTPSEQDDGREGSLSFQLSEKPIPVWNVVRTLNGYKTNPTDLAAEDLSGIPSLPIIPQPDVVQQKLGHLSEPSPNTAELQPQKKKRKTDKL